MKLPLNSKVGVIGGGINGLSYAYFLGKLRPDVKITVFETLPRVGGYINTSSASEETKKLTKLDGRALKMEKGPRTLRGVSSGTLIIMDLFKKFDMMDQVRGITKESPANKKYLLTRSQGQIGEIQGNLVEVPGPGAGFPVIAKFFTSPLGKVLIKGIFKDLFFKKDGKSLDGMSVEEFFSRHFGKPMIHDIGSALMYGIYAADVAHLDVNCVMPALVKMEKTHGSIVKAVLKSIFSNKPAASDPYVKLYEEKIGNDLDLAELKTKLSKYPMITFKDGLSQLCYGLKSNLPSNVEVVLGSGVENISESNDKLIIEADGKQLMVDHVWSSVNTLQLAKMVDNLQLKEVLEDFQYTSVCVCNVLIPRNAKNIKGFGFLVPKSHFHPEIKLMGVIFDSDIEEHSVPLWSGDTLPNVDEHTRATLMVSVRDGIHPTTSMLKMAVRETFANILNGDALDAAVEHAVVTESIPLYDLEFIPRREKVLKLIKDQYKGNIQLGGMAFSPGVGVPDSVVGALEGAVEVSGV